MKKTIQPQKLHYVQILIFLHIFFATVMLQAQNTTFPVGAIPGAIDVSPMGAATYTIPIEVVPGTQGVQPNLSIVYNSMSGMGLLGMKWSLAGLSAITRCGQNPYYDDGNETMSVQFSAEDRLALDGERLLNMNMDGNYWGANKEYATEAENFVRVISSYSNGTLSYFTAYTDDGTIIQYGYTPDSKHTVLSNLALSWYINKITDFNGNYMTFHYGKNNNEFWVDSIKYTGNTKIAPYLVPYTKVKFDYDTIPSGLGRNTYFVGGYGVPQTKILTNITVLYGNSPVRKYQFNYNINDADERTIHLKQILLTEYNENGAGKQLNPTTIEWGAQNNTIDTSQANGLPLEGKIVTGDFNGDGYTDVIHYGIGSNKDIWKLYLYNPTNKSFEYKQQGAHQKEFDKNGNYQTKFYSYDLNNDGKHAFIIAEKISDKPYYEWNVRVVHFNDFSEYTIGPISHFKEIIFGRFSYVYGNNMLFLQSSNNLQYQLLDGGMNVELSFSSNSANISPNIYTADLTGNGRDNLQIVASGSQAKTYDYNVSFYLIRSDDFPATDQRVFYGDFNGDGIQDALVYWNNGSKWSLRLGTGNGKFTDHHYISQLKGSPSLYPIVTADINGDGKDEIIQNYYWMINDSTEATAVKFYYLNNFQKNGSCNILIDQMKLNEWYGKYHLGDFNEDGKVDILVRSTMSDTLRIVFVNANELYEFPKQITDGLGKTIKLAYKPKYYFAESMSHYDLTPLYSVRKYFLPVIQSLQISNGIGNNFNTLSYTFNQPAFSWRRNIYLGFRDFISYNYTENVKEKLVQQIDDSFSIQNGFYLGNREVLVPTQRSTLKIQISYFEIDTMQSNTISNYPSIPIEQLMSSETYSTQMKTISYYPDPYRYIPYSDTTTVRNFLTDTKTITANTVNDAGRLTQSNTKTYNTCNTPANSWIHSETKAYTYATIPIMGNQKKTVPTQILTTQQYGSSELLIADTITCNYVGAGRLNWQRQGNADGSITTTYGNYTSTGLYREKTVSAAGCTPRKDTVVYDATNRFVSQIKNPLGHTTTFIYNPKTGSKLSETDANGLSITYQYTPFGSITKITAPNGIATIDSVLWFTESNPPNAKYCAKTTSFGKPEVIVYYDMLGREVCRLDDGYYYDTRYNEKGQVTKTSYPYSKLTEVDGNKIWHYYTYDSFGRKKTETAPYTNLSYSYNKRRVTVTNNGVSSWKNSDALGRIDTAYDAGGAITYNYAIINENSKKRIQTTITSPGATTVIKSDLWGNRLSITDPDAGTISSAYNGFNELVTQTDAKGNTTTYQYDILGRVTQKQHTGAGVSPLTIQYTYDHYDTYERGKGKMYQIKANNVVEETFIYNDVSRLEQYEKVVDNTTYPFYYYYTPTGQIEGIVYPDNFSVTYNYTSTGKLNEIRGGQFFGNELIYKVHSRNKFGATTKCEYGNGVVTNYTYNTYGLLTRIQTGNKVNNMPADTATYKPNDKGIPGIPIYSVDSAILNYRYAYNEKGLMTSRSESVVNRMENYTYDDLDRLTKITCGAAQQIFSYYNNGNILNNSQVGSYSYGNKPHAVTHIQPITPDVISQNECNVTYNFFNQPTQIIEGDYLFDIFYGSNRQRNKTVKSVVDENGDNYVSTSYYINKYYEIEQRIWHYKSAYSRNYHYIYGDNGIVAIHVDNIDPPPHSYEDSMYYVHTDHLGSYCAITSPSKQVVMQNRFDPWGNYVVRDFTPFFPNVPITFRGFTGHEHYPEFKIINMNGRLYDPIIGRFFSPDKYVANSSFTQDFNRYSYARNCPLMYTDPSGELAWFVPIIIGAVVAATSYTVNVACSDGGFKQNWNWDKFVFNTMFGAVTGAFSMGIGAAVGGALASVGTEGIKGIAGGAITGAANGLFSGTLSGLMQYGMSGDKNAIWRSPLMGMGIGAGIGALNGMADALNKDKNVWLGRDRAMGRSNWSFKNTDKSATHVWKGNTHYGGRSQGMIGPRETRPIERYEQAIQNEKYRVIRELENWITPTHPECPPKTTVFVGSMRGRGSGNYSGWVAEGFELHIDFDGQNILTLPHGNYPPTTITIPSETMIIDMYFTGEHPPFPLPTQAPFKFLIYGVPE